MLLAQVVEINNCPIAFKAIHVSKLNLNYTTWYDALGTGTKGTRRAREAEG